MPATSKILGKGTVIAIPGVTGLVKSGQPFKDSRPVIQGEELVPDGAFAEDFVGDPEPSEAQVTFYAKKGGTTLADLRTLFNNADETSGRVTATFTNANGFSDSALCVVRAIDPNTIERGQFILITCTLLRVPAPPA